MDIDTTRVGIFLNKKLGGENYRQYFPHQCSKKELLEWFQDYAIQYHREMSAVQDLEHECEVNELKRQLKNVENAHKVTKYLLTKECLNGKLLKEEIKKLSRYQGCYNGLKFKFDELQKSRKWISVKDELPKKDTDLLYNPLEFSETVLCFGEKIITLGYWNHDMNCWLFEGEEVEPVTHWKKLPQSPQK